MGIKEKDLPSASGVSGTDYMREVTSGGLSYKALVADVAKYIVENYAGSSLAGSAQSVKSAIDAVNSNTFALVRSSMTSIPNSADLDSYTTAGNYYVQNATTAASLSHTPYTAGLFRLIVSEITGTSRFQMIFTANSSEKIMYYRSSTNSGSTWSGWRLISSAAV